MKRYPKPGLYNELGEWLCAPVPFPTFGEDEFVLIVGAIFGKDSVSWMTQEEYDAL